MKAIVVADRCWNIGKNGGLLAHLPNDLAYFKRQTEGKTVVMGRLTYESLPGQKPLPGRTNVVMTRDPGAFSKKFAHQISAFATGKVMAVRDETELFKLITNMDKNGHYSGCGTVAAQEDVFVIGGGQIYQLLLPYCNEAYVTKLDKVFDADATFPNLDIKPEWEVGQRSEKQIENGLSYWFMRYRRVTG